MEAESDVSVRLQTLMREALAAHRQGDFNVAEARYRQILKQFPAHTDAMHYLGLLSHQIGDDEAALRLLRHAIELNPKSYLYRHNLGGVFHALRRYAEAERCYQETLALKPEHTDAIIGLALARMAQNRFGEALASYEHALAIAPHNFEAWIGRGAAQVELARRTEALTCYREARALITQDADKLQRVGLAFLNIDAAEEARHCFESAIAIRPDYVEAHNNLGVALSELGNLKGATDCFREALRIKPGHASTWHNLVGIFHLNSGDPLWKPLMSLADEMRSRPAADAILLHFSLGKVWEGVGEYERAFRHLLDGNRLQRYALDYNEERQTTYYHNYIHYFDSAFMALHANGGCDDGSPIFIIGMPRSGTTLVEQILASHPLVYGAGEQHLLRQCLDVELGPPAGDDELPRRLRLMDNKSLKHAGERYLTAIKNLAPAAVRITDKLPGNMVLVGLIHLVFPRARIIHCLREPLDTCISCFSQHFATGYHFSYELGELGRFYRLYDELMNHWRAVLPAGSMLEVHYEDVVADMEGQAQKLVAFCGLPWDESCLRFYASSRLVKTASLAQVRQPIYGSSIGRWKHYEQYLGPLIQSLTGKENRN